MTDSATIVKCGFVTRVQAAPCASMRIQREVLNNTAPVQWLVAALKAVGRLPKEEYPGGQRALIPNDILTMEHRAL